MYSVMIIYIVVYTASWSYSIYASCAHIIYCVMCIIYCVMMHVLCAPAHVICIAVYTDVQVICSAGYILQQ